jgi:hypothetical protein
MAYEYDVFLSYKRGKVFGRWVFETFLPLLKEYLANSLNKNEVEIFCDTQEIPPGAAWPQKLQNALTCSRCLIAIWLPAYFHSEWCTKELSLMLYREKQLGYRTLQNPLGLIIPFKVHDGEYFPEFVNDIQCFDCTNFARVGEGFEKTPRYIEFQDQMIEWVEDVAEVIRQAPLWQEEWFNYPLEVDPRLEIEQPLCPLPSLG